MKTLNLFETNEHVTISKFAGGENHVRLQASFTSEDTVYINTRLNSADDLMNLLLATDALRQMGVDHIEVFVPYMPYARQDRVMVPGEPLSVKVLANVLNQQQYKKISVFDAHSDVTPALLNRCNNIPNYQMVKYFLSVLNCQEFTLVSPDLGAYKKVDKLAQQLGGGIEIVTGIKIRDLATGQIIKSDVNTQNLNGKDCIIVDDICDGGRTFIELAAALKQKNAGKLYFIASHGIFSHNALDRLKEAGFQNVCSSNSIAQREETEFFKQYDIFN